jgi:hypothetical protein
MFFHVARQAKPSARGEAKFAGDSFVQGIDGRKGCPGNVQWLSIFAPEMTEPVDVKCAVPSLLQLLVQLLVMF